MSPNKLRKNLKAFLVRDTLFMVKTLRKLAIEKLKERNFYINKKKPISNQEIGFYIEQNYENLTENVEKIIDEICIKIIPQSTFCYIVKQIGVVAILVIPAITALVSCIVNIDFDSNITLIIYCILGIIFLLTLLLSSVIAVILSAIKKDV